MNNPMLPLEQTDIHAIASLNWEALYCELRPRIFKFFLYRLGDVEISQDLTSNTFARAWKARHQYRCELGSFENWIFRIAHNLAIDYIRQKNRQHLVSLEAIADLPSMDEPEDSFIQAWQQQLIQDILAQLSDREQSVLLLKYSMDMKHTAIAQILGLSESNVSNIVFRTLAKMRCYWQCAGGL